MVLLLSSALVRVISSRALKKEMEREKGERVNQKAGHTASQAERQLILWSKPGECMQLYPYSTLVRTSFGRTVY